MIKAIGGILCALALMLAGLADPASAPPTPQVLTPPPGASFPTQILPVLTKAGCNAGACHGAATGQGGFRLSLLGYDPEADHQAITRELAGRRINLSSPPQSLILRKATRDIRHKGGMRIEHGSNDYKTLVAWLEAVAPYGPSGLRVTTIHVSPPDVLLERPDQSVQLRVTAGLSDGASRDVTAHALFTSNDEAIARASPDGAVTALRPGRAAVMVRFGGQVAAARVGLPFRDSGFDEAGFTPRNLVDREVWSELRRMRILPSPRCADDEFLRRAHLDLIGRLPTLQEARAFLAAPSTPASRDRLIGDLLARPEFTDLWTLHLADLLLIDSKRLGEGPARAYHGWLRKQVAANTPIDRLVRELLTAAGDAATSAPANFHRLTQDPRDMGEYVSSALLGVQIACARCHAHPFAAWTQQDYHHFAAFFARTKLDGTRVSVADRGEVQDPRTGHDLPPIALGGGAAAAGHPDRRVALAQWVTSPGNPYFAKAFVNRVWKHLTGRGIVEPVDDLRDSNPPTNPALLDALAADFVSSGYDLRRLVKTIAESRTYQLSSRATDGNRADDRLFSHATVKPLAAQVLADAVADATAVPDQHPGYPAGARAVQLIDARTPSYALDVLGRCSRDVSCDTRARGGGLSQALHLINGPTINAKLRGGVIDRLLAGDATDHQVIDELYLRTLTRFPGDKERTHFAHHLASSPDRRHAVEDLLWALLNSREFAFNH